MRLLASQLLQAVVQLVIIALLVLAAQLLPDRPRLGTELLASVQQGMPVPKELPFLVLLENMRT